jgi:nucleotide-binding universal stress UspA family protein
MKILFPTDGSTHADNALENILAQPWPEGSEIRVLTVPAVFASNLAKYMFGIGAMAATAESALMVDLAKMLADANERLVPKFGKDKVLTMLREGDPAQIIVEMATTWNADLIIMGAHGNSGYNEEARGSIANLVLNHAPCSLQIVNYFNSPSIEQKTKHHFPMEEARLLLALSESPNSQWVVDAVLSRPWPSETLFRVVSVVPEPKSVWHSNFFKDPQFDQAHKTMFARQKEEMEKLVAESGNKLIAKFGKDKVTYHVVEGNVPSLILQFAQDWGADLIMMGAHDRDHDVFEHFMGSVARNVVDNADCSVEIVRKRA